MTNKEKERGMTTEYVYDLLKEMIFGWRISPGQKINIGHLSKELNISAIPLREALSRLHSEKLVIFEANKGYRCSDILDEKGMTDMLEARKLIESYAVRHIIRAKKISVADEMFRLTERLSSVKLGSSYKDVLEFNQLDRQFHCTMVNAGENSFLAAAYEGMHCHLHIARFYHIRGEVDQKEAVAEHFEIIEAIRTRDVERAEMAVFNHIQDAKKRLLESRGENQ
jgi:DNA-binding GntR family transcriptional regulator